MRKVTDRLRITVQVGHVLLRPDSKESVCAFVSLVEALDRLTVRQHILMSDAAGLRRVQACPFATVGAIVRSPVVASCMMPGVDVIHAHDASGGQVGLLLTLTRSIPYVLYADARRAAAPPVYDMVLRRATAVLDGTHIDAERLIEIYRRTMDGAALLSEFPKYPDGGQ